MHYCEDENLVVFDAVERAIRETVYKATPDIFCYERPRIGVVDYVLDGREYFHGKVVTKPGFAALRRHRGEEHPGEQESYRPNFPLAGYAPGGLLFSHECFICEVIVFYAPCPGPARHIRSFLRYGVCASAASHIRPNQNPLRQNGEHFHIRGAVYGFGENRHSANRGSA